MRIVYCFFIIVFFASCHQQNKISSGNCCNSRLRRSFEKYSVNRLGKEFLRMKKSNDPCCEKFGSDFQKLMQALAVKINIPDADSSYVVKAMGTPDATDVPAQYGVFNKGNEKIMIYWWRHWHDFLYIITENGKIKQIKWFYAYE